MQKSRKEEEMKEDLGETRKERKEKRKKRERDSDRYRCNEIKKSR